MSTPDDILELSSLTPERRQVALKWSGNQDGEMVELAVREDFGSFDLMALDRDRREYSRLMLTEKPTKAQQAQAVGILNRLARKLIIGGPDKAIKELPDATKDRVVGLFFGDSEQQAWQMLEKLDPETLETLYRLGTLSPGSNGSTEETPSSGDE